VLGQDTLHRILAVEGTFTFGALLWIDEKCVPFIEIAALGHSNSQMLQLVHCEAMIL